MNSKTAGLYLHIPFCASKCPYCDFYSYRSDDEAKQRYAEALIREIKRKSEELGCKADTLYIGGGTPSVLSYALLCEIIDEARRDFGIDSGEITLECNPHGLTKEFFDAVSSAGVNRISLGLQSASDTERKKLGRRADREEIKRVISYINEAGIDNISLDVMLGIPDSTADTFRKTLDFCIGCEPKHISGYMLKIEENTPFYKLRDSLNLPDEDAVCGMYLEMCRYLGENGYKQYEISNFAKEGCESRHNLKYWNCEEYLGIGPSAHSFIDGRRFYYPSDTEKFIISPETAEDGRGGDFEEYAMLRLRLSQGLVNEQVKERFGFPISSEIRNRAELFADAGYLTNDSEGIRLNEKGFLISNKIISELIY